MEHGSVKIFHLVGVRLWRHPGQNLLGGLLFFTDVLLERIKRETRFVFVPDVFVTIKAHAAYILNRFAGELLLD